MAPLAVWIVIWSVVGWWIVPRVTSGVTYHFRPHTAVSMTRNWVYLSRDGMKVSIEAKGEEYRFAWRVQRFVKPSEVRIGGGTPGTGTPQFPGGGMTINRSDNTFGSGTAASRRVGTGLPTREDLARWFRETSNDQAPNAEADAAELAMILDDIVSAKVPAVPHRGELWAWDTSRAQEAPWWPKTYRFIIFAAWLLALLSGFAWVLRAPASDLADRDPDSQPV